MSRRKMDEEWAEALVGDYCSSLDCEDEKEYETVALFLTAYLDQYPGDAVTHNNRRVAFAALNEDELAHYDFGEAVRFDPEAVLPLVKGPIC